MKGIIMKKIEMRINRKLRELLSDDKDQKLDLIITNLMLIIERMDRRLNNEEIKLNDKEVILTFPHRSQDMIHAPGECGECDRYPIYQKLRKEWRIGYTSLSYGKGN